MIAFAAVTSTEASSRLAHRPHRLPKAGMAPKADDKDKEKKKKSSSDKAKDGSKDPTAKKEKSSSKDASGKERPHKSGKDGADGVKSASKDGKSKSKGQLLNKAAFLSAFRAACFAKLLRLLLAAIFIPSHIGERNDASITAHAFSLKHVAHAWSLCMHMCGCASQSIALDVAPKSCSIVSGRIVPNHRPDSCKPNPGSQPVSLLASRC